MTEGPEKTIHRIQTFVPVEQSMSIDPHLDREKKDEARRRKKDQGSPLTVQERLDREETLRENENSQHVDYHA
jgi:hypothetical protein